MTISSPGRIDDLLSERCLYCGAEPRRWCIELLHQGTKPGRDMRTIARAAMQRAGNRWFRWGNWVISSVAAPRWV